MDPPWIPCFLDLLCLNLYHVAPGDDDPGRRAPDVPRAFATGSHVGEDHSPVRL